MTIRNAKHIQAKSLTHRVYNAGFNTYTVVSGNPASEDGPYTVMICKSGRAVCNCKYGRNHEYAACSHVIAALRTHHHAYVSVWTSRAEARKTRRGIRDTGDGVFITLTPKPNYVGATM